MPGSSARHSLPFKGLSLDAYGNTFFHFSCCAPTPWPGELHGGFIFKDSAKLRKRSEGTVPHPRLVRWTSKALVVPSEARAMRVYIKTSIPGQAASVNSESASQVLGNTRDEAQHSDELSVRSGQMPRVMYITPQLPLLCKEHVETFINISKAPTMHPASRNAFHNTLLPLITSKENYEWTQRAHFKCAVANTRQDFETQQAVPERKYESSLSSLVSYINKTYGEITQNLTVLFNSKWDLWGNILFESLYLHQQHWIKKLATRL